MGAAMADQPGQANPVLYRATRRAAALYQQQPLALAINEVMPGYVADFWYKRISRRLVRPLYLSFKVVQPAECVAKHVFTVFTPPPTR